MAFSTLCKDVHTLLVRVPPLMARQPIPITTMSGPMRKQVVSLQPAPACSHRRNKIKTNQMHPRFIHKACATESGSKPKLRENNSDFWQMRTKTSTSSTSYLQSHGTFSPSCTRAPPRPRTRDMRSLAFSASPAFRVIGCATSNRQTAVCCISPAERARPKVTVTPANSKGFGASITIDEMTQSLHGDIDPIWALLRREAENAATSEPQLASELYSAILVHDTLEDTLATVLANALHTATFQATQWVELFRDVLSIEPEYGLAVRADIAATMSRDPASSYAAGVLLYSKGFHALESWRLAHWLWKQGRTSLALYMQSRISSRFAVDIHPAAEIGSGVLIDHGTGIVIGETARLGDNVSILQNVTLGGTGKEKGDRHPKVGDGVMIGAGATVLGNIQIGEGSHIAACSVVLKPVEPFAVVSGVPAKVVGKVSYKQGVFPSFMMDQRLSIQTLGAKNPYQNVVTGPVKGVDEAKPGEEFSGNGI